MKTNVSTRGLTAAIRQGLAKLRHEAPGAQMRLLDDDAVPAIVLAARKLLTYTTDKDVVAVVTAHGGFVPTGYGSSALADKVVVTLDLVAGSYEVSAIRAAAQARAFGEGEWLVRRIRRAGQSLGRMVHPR